MGHLRYLLFPMFYNAKLPPAARKTLWARNRDEGEGSGGR